MQGMHVTRRFTDGKSDPFSAVTWAQRDVVMNNNEGVEIFRQEAVEMPAWWNEVQAQVCISKYFKGALNTPQRETSVKQMFVRVARTISSWGIIGGYFADDQSVLAFNDELLYMFCTGRFAFNSPVWFNLGDETSKPQASACFINSVDDTMESILSLGQREGMQFKFGSGAGTDLSGIRSRKEGMRGGGNPSGPLSFARGWDKMSGAIRSGGKKRRAAKMLSMLCYHPDIREFILHKVQEEKKAKALIAAGYDGSIDGEAYATVDGQNANNSVRLTDEFMHRATCTPMPDGTVCDDAMPLIAVTTGLPIETDSASALLDLICTTSCASGDPGVQFHDEMNRWNKCPSYGKQRATNPCSEFSHVCDTSCNLGSHNLRKYQNDDGTLNVADFSHGVMMSALAQEIICGDATGVMFRKCTCGSKKGHKEGCPKLHPRSYGAWYPTLTIRRRTQETRPLGIGFCGAGAFLMYAGLAYDSNEARLMMAGITALMTGQAYATSASIAQHCGGAFPAYAADASHMMMLMRAYAANAQALCLQTQSGPLSAPYFPSGEAYVQPLPSDLRAAIGAAWRTALTVGERYGFRNDEVTAIAPTGTISYLMGAAHSTSGEPLMGLILYKRLVGAGYITIAADDVTGALRLLGYSAEQVQRIADYCAEQVPTGKMIEGSPEMRPRGHLESAPGLKPEHLPIFDTAFKTDTGTRYISPEGHYLMLAAMQVHTSMAISKTVNLPEDATPEDFKRVITECWLRGVKSVSIYRDKSKGSQPVSTSVRSDADNIVAPQDPQYAEIINNLSAHCGETGNQAESAAEALNRILQGHKLLMQVQREHVTGSDGVVDLLNRMISGTIPVKRDLGNTVAEIRHKFDVAGHTCFLKIGVYPDGKPGELWITVSKDGSTLNGVYGCFARAISYALQYGVPMETLVEKFKHMSFEPAGFTDLGRVSSIVDYIFRWIETRFPVEAPQRLLQAALAMGAKMPVEQPLPQRQPQPQPVRQVQQVAAAGPACRNCGNLQSLNAGGKCYTCTYCGTQDGGCGP